MLLRTRAPAKINLTLHVVRRRTDGYHDLESLVAFAGVADVLELWPGEPFGLWVGGPTAEAAGLLDDNLVLRAARALAERVPGLRLGAFRLTKRLPVGAGIGGGSSDAAAALRLLARINGIAPTDDRLLDAARVTGADVPVCLHPRSRMMRGTGDRLGLPFAPRPLYAVLVNPGVHVETRLVFKGMGLAMGEETAWAAHPELHDGLGHDAFLDSLAGARNDMQRAAGVLAPAIADVLGVLTLATGCRLVRMSGSGSTCFGLFLSRSDARLAAILIRRDHPQWWVRATALR